MAYLSRYGALRKGRFHARRIALSRELLRETDLLILDEATNALDLETEAHILRNMRDAFPDMTVLMIAHRPESLALADRVLRIRDGRILGPDNLEVVQTESDRRHA